MIPLPVIARKPNRSPISDEENNKRSVLSFGIAVDEEYKSDFVVISETVEESGTIPIVKVESQLDNNAGA